MGQLDHGGSVLGRWPGLLTDRYDQISGFAFLPNGGVYLSHRRLGADEGMVHSKLDKQTGEWKRIDVSAIYPDDGRNHATRILGADGDLLVVAVDRLHLFWVRPE